MTASFSYLDGINATVAVDDRDVAAFFANESEPEAVVERTLSPATGRLLKSELASISDVAWTRFVEAMKTAGYDSSSGSNSLGAWEMRPKRLADLGLMTNLHYERTPLNRLACDGDFIGDVDPTKSKLTRKTFLENPQIQYLVFATSMRRYVDGLNDGTVEYGPVDGLSLSGALAVLHRCGPLGLKKWSDESSRFSDTVDLVDRVNGLF